jgi:hypothetical protein
MIDGLFRGSLGQAFDHVASYDNILLPELAHQFSPQLRPPCPVNILRHNLANGDVVMLGRFSGLPAACAGERAKLVTPPKRSVWRCDKRS